jgi:hypothetical protein
MYAPQGYIGALAMNQPRGYNSGRSLHLKEPMETGCMTPGALALNQPMGYNSGRSLQLKEYMEK